MKVGDLVVVDTGNMYDDCNALLGLVLEINEYDVHVNFPNYKSRWFLCRHLKVV